MLRRILCLFLLPLLCSATGRAERGIQQTQTPLSRICHLETALSDYAAQNKVSLLCEGEPFVRELSEPKGNELLLRMNKEQDTEVRFFLLVKAYDYEAQKIGRNTYALTKQYSFADDFPFLSLSEAAERLRRYLNACREYECSARSRPFSSLFSSMTTEQRVSIAEGLRVESLSPDQQQNIGLLVNQTKFNGITSLRTLSEVCFGMLGKNALFRDARTMKEDKGMRLDLYPILVGAGSGSRTRAVYMLGKLAPTDADVKPDPFVAIHPVPISIPVETICDQLRRSKLPDSGVLDVRVDAALAKKPVYAVGLEYGSTPDIMAALGVCLDTRVRSGAGVLRLALPVVEPIKSAYEIPAVANKILPAAFLRWVSASRMRVGGLKEPLPKLLSEPPTTSFEERKNYMFIRQKSNAQLYAAAKRRLRTNIDPLLAKQADGRLLISDMSEEVHSLIALFLLSNDIPNWESLTAPIAAYVDSLNKARVQLQPVEGKPNNYKLSILYKDENGITSGLAIGAQFNLPTK